MATEGPFENTDKELWREVDGDFYSPKLFVTQEGRIGIDVNGLCIIKSVREWHKLAAAELDLPASVADAASGGGFDAYNP